MWMWKGLKYSCKKYLEVDIERTLDYVVIIAGPYQHVLVLVWKKNYFEIKASRSFWVDPQ